MGLVIFNGVSSQDLYIRVQHPPEYTMPERDYEITHVPGRNGDVIVDNGSWNNVERIYNICMDATKNDYTEVASSIASWLHTPSGYARLEDSYEPDYFRIATYKDSASISNLFMKAGEMDLTFDCKPQRFLKSGETPVIFNIAGRLRNPTNFDARPLIRVNGSGAGTVIIGGYTVTILSIESNGIKIDCEMEDAYDIINANRNKDIQLTEFPRLRAGDNIITFSGGVTSVEIIPRWWTI